MPIPTDTNNPAFPCAASHSGDGEQIVRNYTGLSIRQYAAIHICAGMVASSVTNDMSYDEIAARAWKQAAVLLSHPAETTLGGVL